MNAVRPAPASGDVAAPLALVTGGLHRIGAGIARRLAVAGYDLALHYHRRPHPETGLEAAIGAAGRAMTIIQADLMQSDAPERLIAACPRVPALLVNGASIFEDGGWERLDTESLHRHMTINFTAPVLLAKALVAAARDPVAIVNILDQRVTLPNPDQTAYTLSKQALWQATRTLAVAFGDRARVNAVAPGLVLPTQDYAAGQMERIAATMPLGALASREDIADAVAYLAMATSVTGQTIAVDGGANLRGWARDFVHLER